jgi:hypothetical protein
VRLLASIHHRQRWVSHHDYGTSTMQLVGVISTRGSEFGVSSCVNIAKQDKIVVPLTLKT